MWTSPIWKIEGLNPGEAHGWCPQEDPSDLRTVFLTLNAQEMAALEPLTSRPRPSLASLPAAIRLAQGALESGHLKLCDAAVASGANTKRI